MFIQQLLNELEQLLGSDDIKTFVKSEPSENMDTAVKLVHEPSGIEAICDEYESQVQNKALALIRLNQKMKADL